MELRIVLTAVLVWGFLVLAAVSGWFHSDYRWKRWIAWALLVAATIIHAYNVKTELAEARHKRQVDVESNVLADWIVDELEKGSQLEYKMRGRAPVPDAEFLKIFRPQIEQWRDRVGKRLGDELPKSGADARFFAFGGEVGRGPSYYEYTHLTKLMDVLAHVLDRPESYTERSLRRRAGAK